MTETVHTATAKSTSISSPWMTYYKKIVALFGDDPDLEITYDDSTRTVTIASVNTYKIQALEKLLEPSKTFGNVTITVKCSVKNPGSESVATLFKTAFADNPHFACIKERRLADNLTEVYALFKKEVIQFFNDDTSDYYGNWNGLCEDIMHELMKTTYRINLGTETDD